LMEIFQWLTIAESMKDSLSLSQRQAVEEEIADVMIYAIRMAQILDIDILKAMAEKINKNDAKYPVDKIKGKSRLED
jgi:dCTP diphosphatase